jgi:hypothetical protein
MGEIFGEQAVQSLLEDRSDPIRRIAEGAFS